MKRKRSTYADILLETTITIKTTTTTTKKQRNFEIPEHIDPFSHTFYVRTVSFSPSSKITRAQTRAHLILPLIDR